LRVFFQNQYRILRATTTFSGTRQSERSFVAKYLRYEDKPVNERRVFRTNRAGCAGYSLRDG
jgi:hypothetical protein